MKKYFTILITFMFVFSSYIVAQEECEKTCEKTCTGKSFVDVSFGADVVSRYLWRGMEFGGTSTAAASPQFQPYINFDFKLNDENIITLGGWGSYSFSNEYEECDLTLKYAYSPKNVGTFSLKLSDFYFPHMGFSYFNFDKKGLGGHTVELDFAYDGTEKFPVHFLVANNVLNDADASSSFYAEVGYTVKIKDVSVFLFTGGATGISPWNQIYEDGFKVSFTGLTASKTVKITDDFSVPVGVTYMVNPHLKKSYIAVKFSF